MITNTDFNTVFSPEELLNIYSQKFKDVKFGTAETTTYAPIYYFMNNKGKQIRPLLLLASCNLFKGNLEEALYPAFGIQLFHNFTLVHDDIIDEADIRRGLPTVHKKFGINKAIISGDIMMIYAYDYLLKVDPSNILEVYKNFNISASQIIEGQQMDIDFEKRMDVTEAEYIKMIAYKTSVLLAESLRIGAIISKANDKNKQLIYDFGLNLGLSFQIKDDWLDAFGAGEKFGKKIGGDILQNKKTMLFIKAWEAADKSTREKIISLMDNQNEDEKVTGMLNIYNDLRINEKITALMTDYFEKSLDFLSQVSVEDNRKQHLLNFAHTIFNRDH